MAIWMVAGGLLLAAPAFPQGEKTMGQGRAVVTILPKKHGMMPASISQKDLSIKVNGKAAEVTSWKPLRGPGDRVELVLLIDSAGRNSLGSQFGDITNFINGLPPNVKIAIAYMINGQSYPAGPLTTDHAQALQGLHMPGGIPGSSASPYFCLSDLAKRWPSRDSGARREVVMITDGIDYYERRYDPEDPYVEAAINDSVRAGMVVYSIYWINVGFEDRTMYGNNTGQNLLYQLTEATGGTNFWGGVGNPVTLQPFFEEFVHRLENQYELGFSARLDGKPGIQTMRLKVGGPAVDVEAPQFVFVDHGNAAE
jgi:hypothetical protein